MTGIHLTCPSCLAKNRLPRGRLDDAPRCGRCKTPLFDGHAVDLTADNHESILTGTDIPVVVDCWAPWCAPCRSFASVFTQAAVELEPGFRFAKLNTDEEPRIAERWAIRGIPTLILFSRGRERDRVSGALSPMQLRDWLARAVAA